MRVLTQRLLSQSLVISIYLITHPLTTDLEFPVFLHDSTLDLEPLRPKHRRIAWLERRVKRREGSKRTPRALALVTGQVVMVISKRNVLGMVGLGKRSGSLS